MFYIIDDYLEQPTWLSWLKIHAELPFQAIFFFLSIPLGSFFSENSIFECLKMSFISCTSPFILKDYFPGHTIQSGQWFAFSILKIFCHLWFPSMSGYNLSFPCMWFVFYFIYGNWSIPKNFHLEEANILNYFVNSFFLIYIFSWS